MGRIKISIKKKKKDGTLFGVEEVWYEWIGEDENRVEGNKRGCLVKKFN